MNFSEGHDIWLVSDETMDIGSDRLVGPMRVPVDYRTIMVKYTYTFML
jgi:hypothetical protein